ncbi:MAG TPA: pyruvate kinase [Tepidisphaeraceae bacterium]|nr:pyruvate kinase [Tepidisphaeraceae bacterium]
MIRTKIIATLGPACGSADLLYDLFKAGVDVCRLNFSHGDLDWHLMMLRYIREAAARHDQPIAVLGDLCGPKIRLGKIADHNGTGGMAIETGEELIVQRGEILGEKGRVSSIYPHFVDDVEIGHRVLIEDGLLRFICTDKSYSEVRCKCTIGGVVKSSKGINLPDTLVNVPSVTDRDWECVDWAIDNDLDYLALSFVRKADDIELLREHLRNKVSDIHLIAKIEKAEALSQIEGIIEASDGLMIARGDLGVEMDLASVPIIQKDLTRRCQTAGKPVIVATQMLQSMIEQASPTRAEVSDVANAIFDGTDAIMLSGETSVGKFPVPTVMVMHHVADVTENYINTVPTGPATYLKPTASALKFSAAIARGTWQVVQDLKVKLVVIWSQTGATARIFSKNRFPIPILALSSDHRALRRMALHYGVIPQEMEAPATLNELVDQVDARVRSSGYAEAGDRIVVVAGSSLGTPGTMNAVVVHTIGESWTHERQHYETEYAPMMEEMPSMESGNV